MNNFFLTTTFISSAALGLLSQELRAENLAQRANLPGWTEGVNVSAGFANDSMDFDTPGMDDIDSQGVQVELSNDYNLDGLYITQSALKGRMTTTGDEATEIDNKSIGLTQRLIRKVPAGEMWLRPSLGLGLNYGGVEYGALEDATDQQYISYNGEAAVRLDTLEGFAPFVSYNYEIADRENTDSSLNIQTVTAGIAAVF